MMSMGGGNSLSLVGSVLFCKAGWHAFKERDSEKRSKESHNGRSDDISLWGREKGC